MGEFQTNNEETRFFPQISAELYKIPSGNNLESRIDSADAKLLHLGGRRLGFWKKYLSAESDPEHKLCRLLHFHKEALTSEIAGEFGRADFFWKEIQNQFSKLEADEKSWQHIAGKIGFTGSPRELKVKCAEELFMDTHLAFYNSYIEQEENLSPESRAFKHSEHLRKWISAVSLTGNELLAVVKPIVDDEIQVFEKSEKFDKAINAVLFLLAYFADREDYQSKLAELCFAKTLSLIKNESTESGARRDAYAISRIISQIEKLCATYSHNIDFYRVLGQIYHIYAAKLSDSGNISTGLLAIEKSLHFYPLSSEAREMREQLSTLMEDLQKQFEELQEEYRIRGIEFSPSNPNLVSQIKTGFSLVNAYISSEDAQNLLAAFYVAQAYYLWKEIGLPKPAENHDLLALSLVQGLNQSFDESPSNHEEIAKSWQRAVENNPILSNIDGSPVIRFIASRLIPDDVFTPAVETDESEEIGVRKSGRINIFKGKGRIKGGEPAGYWFFSGQNLGVKVRTFAALLILILAGGLYISESRAASRRNEAFDQIANGMGSQKYELVLDGAEKFLDNGSLVRSDTREQQVRDHYDEAIVRFIARQNSGTLDPNTLARIEHYRKLTGNPTN